MAPPSMNDPADTHDAWPGQAVYLPARPQDKEAARAGWEVLFPVVIIRQMTERKMSSSRITVRVRCIIPQHLQAPGIRSQ
jgi:hypothetical protein